MKRIVSLVVLLSGLLLFLLARFILQPSTAADWIMRSAGILMIVGIFFTSFFTAKEVRSR